MQRPLRGPRRWPAGIAALALLLSLSSLGTAPAQAATRYGHDISWPQCPTSQGGFGLPMPPTSTDFVIVGLTRGLPFTENPCLASQLSWVRTHGKPAHGYTMAGFPTAAQLSTYGGAGPWSGTTRAARLSNVGYAEATSALQTLRRVGFDPDVVWIDVEPRPAQPWPGSTSQQRRENRYVVEGLMRGLRDAGKAYGLYSYTAGWQEITGGWRLPGVPVWATAGRLDYPDEALDRCRQPSFSGGRVVVSQWYDDTRDYNLTCDPYTFTPLPVPPSSLSGSTADFDGDWSNDVLARTSSGDLRLYPGNGSGRWLPSRRIGTGWGPYDLLETPGDLTGDGAGDVVARERATGVLWTYPGNGRGGWLPRVRVGGGWGAMDALVGPGDFDGDGWVDLLARDAASGALWLYRGTGRGTFLARVQVGSGWRGMDALVGPGDFDGDGTVDLLAREAATGALWLYRGNGSGRWLPRVQVGRGWQVMDALVAPGDFDGNRTPDVLAREAATGYLWLYPRTESGRWAPRVRVGHGWHALDPLF